MESTKRELFDKLRSFHNDKDFVLGVISNAEIEENFQRIIDFMDNNEEDVSVENIIALSLMLGKGIDTFRDTAGPD